MHAEEAGRGGGRGEPQKQTCGVEVHQKERGKGAPGGGTSLCKVRRPRPVKGPHHIVSGGWHSRSSCTFISGSPAPSSLWQVHGWLVSLSPVPGSLESLPGRQAQGSTQRRNINAPRKPAPLSGWGRRMASPRLTDQAGPSVLTRTHHGCWLPVLPAVCRGGWAHGHRRARLRVDATLHRRKGLSTALHRIFLPHEPTSKVSQSREKERECKVDLPPGATDRECNPGSLILCVSWGL